MASRYDVYGMGNALVDIQYEVETAYLESMKIDKGMMTLVDEARQAALMEGIGHPPVKRSSGGSAANTMIGVACYGGNAAYTCKVGDDEWGEFYLADLAAAGVRTNPAGRAEGVTGKCLVLITPDAERTMNTFLGITGEFGPEQLEEDVLKQSAYVYVEGYLLFGDDGFAAAQKAQEMARHHGVPVALTFSDPAVVGACRERIAALMKGGVDLLFCNEEEARSWTGADTTEAAVRELSASLPRFAVTCGAEGALVGEGGEVARVPGLAVEAVDTNGAGDMFAGGFLFGITHGYSGIQAATLANYGSSRVVSRFGPRLEESLAGQVETILA